jgi:hypothetical protein
LAMLRVQKSERACQMHIKEETADAPCVKKAFGSLMPALAAGSVCGTVRSSALRRGPHS